VALAVAHAVAKNPVAEQTAAGAQQSSATSGSTNFSDTLTAILDAAHQTAATGNDAPTSPSSALFGELMRNGRNTTQPADPSVESQMAAKLHKTKTADADAQAAASQQTAIQQLQGANPALRSINIAALRAALAQQKQDLISPGTHILPVMPGKGSSPDGTDGKATLSAQNQTKLTAALSKAAAASATGTSVADKTMQAVKAAVTAATQPVTKIETAAMSNTSHQALHAPTPAAKTEASALSVNFDANGAKSGGGNDNSQANSGGGQPQGGTARDTAQPAAAAATPVPDAPQPAAASASLANTTTAATNVGVASAPMTSPATVSATLQVTQQAQHAQAAPPPDLSALAVSIAAKSSGGARQFDIRMEPAELGRVEVRLSVDSTGKAQAHLVAEKPQTLELLKNDQSSLESSLKNAGLDLANNGLNFSLKGQQQSSTPTFNARSRALSIAAVPAIDTASSSPSSTRIAPGDSRLDIRV
jgi:flagellar hook-length control protein FliK